MKDCIPQVYGSGIRTLSEWGLTDVDLHLKADANGRYYGILMEWLKGAEPLSESNISTDLAMSVTTGMVRIHDAGVYHGDARARNILVYPGTNRAVWIDFSCAQVGWEEFYGIEMESGGQIGIQYVTLPF